MQSSVAGFRLTRFFSHLSTAGCDTPNNFPKFVVVISKYLRINLNSDQLKVQAYELINT